MSAFSLNISYLRDKENLSQKALGALFGVKSATISLWENGKNAPPLPVLLKIADHFKVNVGISISEDLQQYEKQLATVGDNLTDAEVGKLSMEEQAVRYHKIESAKHITDANDLITADKLADAVQINALTADKMADVARINAQAIESLIRTNEKLINKLGAKSK